MAELLIRGAWQLGERRGRPGLRMKVLTPLAALAAFAGAERGHGSALMRQTRKSHPEGSDLHQPWRRIDPPTEATLRARPVTSRRWPGHEDPARFRPVQHP